MPSPSTRRRALTLLTLGAAAAAVPGALPPERLAEYAGVDQDLVTRHRIRVEGDQLVDTIQVEPGPGPWRPDEPGGPTTTAALRLVGDDVVALGPLRIASARRPEEGRVGWLSVGLRVLPHTAVAP
jgi:hypothetical protein